MNIKGKDFDEGFDTGRVPMLSEVYSHHTQRQSLSSDSVIFRGYSLQEVKSRVSKSLFKRYGKTIGAYDI